MGMNHEAYVDKVLISHRKRSRISIELTDHFDLTKKTGKQK